MLNGFTTTTPPAAPSPYRPPREAPVVTQGLAQTTALTSTVYLPLVSRGVMTERRAVWVTRYDWTGVGQAPDPAKIDEIVANVAGAGFNAIFFQVRAAGDAYYTPGLEPWAARLTGSLWETLGHDPGWDPLARLIERAHAAGLEVHAYANVYPAWVSPPEGYGQLAPPATTPAQMFDLFTYRPDHPDHPGQYGLGWTWRQYDEQLKPMLLSWGGYLWASPGLDQVRDHIVAVMVDLVTRYSVDGVHLDLVRYAGPQYSFDPWSNEAAGAERSPQRDQWQRDRVTDLMGRVYQQTTALRPHLWVSAAVWPYYLDQWGWGLSEGYADYYQDSKGWLALGVVDAIAPMLYGGVCDDFDRWRILMQDFVASAAGRHVYPGVGSGYADFDAIAARIRAARDAGAAGQVLFSYGELNRRGYWDDLANGPYAVPVVPPPPPAR